jgi:hypothetical protein
LREQQHKHPQYQNAKSRIRKTMMLKTDAIIIVWRGVAGLHAGEFGVSQVPFRGRRVWRVEVIGRGGILDEMMLRGGEDYGT